MHTKHPFFLFLLVSTLIFFTFTTAFANNGLLPTEIDTEALGKPPYKGGSKPPHHGLPPRKKPPHGPPTEIETEAAHKPSHHGRKPPRGHPPQLDTKP
ncbi:hypothetical protein L1987_73265 [Smallanthus sonchifolius]|uniref:Uncharacterized protein n=1 Tax=Smallanthus sonchifolius TaxID=185202 RepID=A0ACB9A087_9ASTR|nr:hypothetical protein L1987_73265 [Smallanthus sonchifolius]